MKFRTKPLVALLPVLIGVALILIVASVPSAHDRINTGMTYAEVKAVFGWEPDAWEADTACREDAACWEDDGAYVVVFFDKRGLVRGKYRLSMSLLNRFLWHFGFPACRTWS